MKFILIVLSFFFIFSFQIKSLAWKESNGGDAIAAQFVSVGWYIADELETRIIEPEIRLKLVEAIKKTQIVVQDKLYLNGVEKDAINHPDPDFPVIEINRPRFEIIIQSLTASKQLVLHEYLFIIGIDDSDYHTSSKIIKAISVYYE